MTGSREGWVWHGYACHFICADRCAFHLGTSIDGKILVSTVGHFCEDPKRFPSLVSPIGASADQNFETLVFEIDGYNSHRNPVILSYTEIAGTRYKDSEEAEAGHYAMCLKYSNQEVQP